MSAADKPSAGAVKIVEAAGPAHHIGDEASQIIARSVQELARLHQSMKNNAALGQCLQMVKDQHDELLRAWRMMMAAKYPAADVGREAMAAEPVAWTTQAAIEHLRRKEQPGGYPWNEDVWSQSSTFWCVPLYTAPVPAVQGVPDYEHTHEFPTFEDWLASDIEQPETAREYAKMAFMAARAMLAAAPPAPEAAPTAFQARVQPWMTACFGPEISADKIERNHRFLEEALELVQACDCTQDEAHQLVDYVYGRPVGEKQQEVGGVMVTLAALCLAQGMDMHECGETELARIWTKVEKIRAKQAAKPKHSPLPEHSPTAANTSGLAIPSDIDPNCPTCRGAGVFGTPGRRCDCRSPYNVSLRAALSNFGRPPAEKAPAHPAPAGDALDAARLDAMENMTPSEIEAVIEAACSRLTLRAAIDAAMQKGGPA